MFVKIWTQLLTIFLQQINPHFLKLLQISIVSYIWLHQLVPFHLTEKICWGTSVRDLHLVDPRKWAFSGLVPVSWNVFSPITPKVRLGAPMMFPKSLKICLLWQWEGSQEPETYFDSSITEIDILTLFHA